MNDLVTTTQPEGLGVNTWIADNRPLLWISPDTGMVVFGSCPRMVCNDGFSMSVQADAFLMCSPRGDAIPYSAVEVGLPSEVVPELLPYASKPDDPTQSVYGFVPVGIVEAVIRRHGGLIKSVVVDGWE